MRYSDLVENIGSSDSIRDMIQTIIISLSASGVEKIPLKSVLSELQNKTNMQVPIDTITSILQGMPFVSSVDDNYVMIGNVSNQAETEESSKDKVAQMAKAPADNSF